MAFLPTLSRIQPTDGQTPFGMRPPQAGGTFNPFAAPMSPAHWAAGQNPNLPPIGGTPPIAGGGRMPPISGTPPIAGRGGSRPIVPPNPVQPMPPTSQPPAQAPSSPFQAPTQGAGGYDRNGFPAVSESGNGWVKYADGGFFQYDSAAGQKALSMTFGAAPNGANLDAEWAKLPLSWRADMAQNWSQDAIRTLLDGQANPNGMFEFDGQKMLGSQMVSAVASKMKQAISQAQQNAAPKPKPSVDAFRVMAGVG